MVQHMTLRHIHRHHRCLADHRTIRRSSSGDLSVNCLMHLDHGLLASDHLLTVRQILNSNDLSVSCLMHLNHGLLASDHLLAIRQILNSNDKYLSQRKIRCTFHPHPRRLRHLPTQNRRVGSHTNNTNNTNNSSSSGSNNDLGKPYNHKRLTRDIYRKRRSKARANKLESANTRTCHLECHPAKAQALKGSNNRAHHTIVEPQLLSQTWPAFPRVDLVTYSRSRSDNRHDSNFSNHRQRRKRWEQGSTSS